MKLIASLSSLALAAQALQPYENCPEVVELKEALKESDTVAFNRVKKCFYVDQYDTEKKYDKCIERAQVPYPDHLVILKSCWTQLDKDMRMGLLKPPTFPEMIRDLSLDIMQSMQEGAFDDMEMTFDMSMNQLGSNYFIGGDFIVPDNCNGLQLPEGVNADDILAQQTADDDTTMGMSMNQIGSNYFVMGNYIRPDKTFISFDEFMACFTDDTEIGANDNATVQQMKYKAVYECVEAAEKARRVAQQANDETLEEAGPVENNPNPM